MQRIGDGTDQGRGSRYRKEAMKVKGLRPAHKDEKNKGGNAILPLPKLFEEVKPGEYFKIAARPNGIPKGGPVPIFIKKAQEKDMGSTAPNCRCLDDNTMHYFLPLMKVLSVLST
jgi:hypothetical protein